MQASCDVGTAATSWVIGFYKLYLLPQLITIWQLHEFLQSKYISKHTRACPLPPKKAIVGCSWRANSCPVLGIWAVFPPWDIAEWMNIGDISWDLSAPSTSPCLIKLSKVLLAVRTPTTEVPHCQRFSFLMYCYWFWLIISVKSSLKS